MENSSNKGSLRETRDMQRREDQPSDFTLVASGGKEFRVHRSVLSEASVFFLKLLSSDMMESKQGIVRLDMLTETLMEEILQFIYTGSVQITATEKAEDLIMGADYLCLALLKTFAGKFLEERLSTSNCVSTYYFAENLCKDLAAKTSEFIHVNFVAVVNEDEFLRLSSQQVEKWISSDEIVLDTEEEVFKTIIKWIEQDRNGRKIHFANLFRHVLSILPDYLSNDVVTNQLVKDLEDDPCVHQLKSALIYGVQAVHSDLPWPQTPRRTLEEDGILAFEHKQTLLYLPQKDKWFQLPDTHLHLSSEMVSCQGKIYSFSYRGCERYDSLVNSWSPVSSPCTDKKVCHAVVVRGDIYLILNNEIMRRNDLVLWKYSTALVSWQPVSSCHWRGKEEACVVVLDKDIYTVSGFDRGRIHTEARRYDTTENTSTDIADIQKGRRMAFGASLHGKIYVAGGTTASG